MWRIVTSGPGKALQAKGYGDNRTYCSGNPRGYGYDWTDCGGNSGGYVDDWTDCGVIRGGTAMIGRTAPYPILLPMGCTEVALKEANTSLP
jgi:hypothetical protein